MTVIRRTLYRSIYSQINQEQLQYIKVKNAMIRSGPVSCPPSVPAITQPSTIISCATHRCTRPSDRFVYPHQLKNRRSTMAKSWVPMQVSGFWDRPCEVVISIPDRTAVTLENRSWPVGSREGTRPESPP